MQQLGISSHLLKNGLITLTLFVVSLFVNKYVLTTLQFQYPTIFQGWQTLVGVILFRLLVMTEKIDVNLSEISRYQVLVWLPPMLLYVWSIYSGSVALSQLAVPCFLAEQNVVLLAPLFMDVVIHHKAHWRHLVAASGIGLSAIMLYLSDTQHHSAAYAWMLLHIVSSAAIHVYHALIKQHVQISEYHQTFLNYALSVVVLAPSTVLLGDALASRRHFAFWYYYRFYVCCVVSGVCGICLTLHTITTKEQPAADLMLAVAKVVASLLSLCFFTFHASTANYMWILLNLACGVLLQYPQVARDKKRDDVQDVYEI